MLVIHLFIYYFHLVPGFQKVTPPEEVILYLKYAGLSKLLLLPPSHYIIAVHWNVVHFSINCFLLLLLPGYGHLSPTTYLGKVICILYSLLGVPINGILVGSLGAYFGNKAWQFDTIHIAAVAALKAIYTYDT